LFSDNKAQKIQKLFFNSWTFWLFVVVTNSMSGYNSRILNFFKKQGILLKENQNGGT